MRLRSIHLFATAAATLAVPSAAAAAEAPTALPGWLAARVGEGKGQVAMPVLVRARALYLEKRAAGLVKNPCYFAMDATRPNDAEGETAGRFYIVCEAERSIRAISAGHGAGRTLDGVVDFHNERVCARNFGNAMNSNLTAGGAYVTAEATTSFKGLYQTAAHEEAPLMRTFIAFDGEGDTANARQRAIGGHAAVTLKGICRRKSTATAGTQGEVYVPVGELVDYSGGRSDGCTSWSPSDAQKIQTAVAADPTTLYIYPGSADIQAVARAQATGQSLASAGLYWNTSCLQAVGTPQFWSKQTLEPIIARYERDHPRPAPKPAPMCPEPAPSSHD